MLKILGIALLFTFPTLKADDSAYVCSMIHYSKVKQKVEARGSFDKYKHCAVSCLLALRCPSKEVLHVGVFKEGLDLLGYGNAEMADLEADMKGINFVTKKKATNDETCITLCQSHFSESCQ